MASSIPNVFLNCKLKLESIIIVSGVYKSGTSALTEKFEKEGYFNPAIITNPYELGYSRFGSRYWTRECSIARSININISSDTIDVSNPWRLIGGYLRTLNELSKKNVVIKGPQFLDTALYWSDLANEFDIRFLLALSTRDKTELKDSWDHAPWTQSLLTKDKNMLDTLLEKQRTLCDQIRARSTQVETYAFR